MMPSKLSAATCAFFKAAQLNNDAVSNAMLGKASEAIPMFHHALGVMRDLIVLVEQPCHDQSNPNVQEQVYCSSCRCVEPRILGCKSRPLSSFLASSRPSSSCIGLQQDDSSVLAAPEGTTKTEYPTTENAAANSKVNNHLHVSHKQEKNKRTIKQLPAGDSCVPDKMVEVPTSFFELYDELLYIDFVRPSSERKGQARASKNKDDNHDDDDHASAGHHHHDHVSGLSSSQQFVAPPTISMIESRRYCINLVVGVTILNVAIMYHKMSVSVLFPLADDTRKRNKLEANKLSAQRLYQKCISLMTVLLFGNPCRPAQQGNNKHDSSTTRKLCTFVMLASMNNLLCIIDSINPSDAHNGGSLGVQYCQHVHAWSAREQEERQGTTTDNVVGQEQEQSQGGEEAEGFRPPSPYYYNHRLLVDDDSANNDSLTTSSIIFCQRWMTVFEENVITMQLKRLGVLLPLRTALAA